MARSISVKEVIQIASDGLAKIEAERAACAEAEARQSACPDCADLQRQLAAAKAEAAAAQATWRCFHCGFESADPAEAEAHFGERDDAEEFKPLCKWWKRIDDGERAQTLQDTIQQLNAERDETARLLVKIEGLEYRLTGFEDLTYSRFKVRSINDAYSLYDSMEGRALAAEEKLAAAQEREQRAITCGTST
jgi:hypothetical protein